MALYETIPADLAPGADFAVRLENDSLSPYVKKGETVRLRRSVELRDGDLGLFCAGEGMVFRQFCQDSRGNVYLFQPDRRRKDEDLFFPADGPMPVCYGRVCLDKPIPLPAD